MQLLSREEVLKRTSLSRTTLFRKERSDEFPKAIRISANRVAYNEEDVDSWINDLLSRNQTT